MKLPNVYWGKSLLCSPLTPGQGWGIQGKDLHRSEAGDTGGRWTPQSQEEPSAGERDPEVGMTTNQVS